MKVFSWLPDAQWGLVVVTFILAVATLLVAGFSDRSNSGERR